MRAGIPCCVFLASSALGAGSAAAHAPPYGLALLFTGGEDAPAVLTNRGLIVPDEGALRLRCNLAYGASADASGFVSADGARIVVAHAGGVFSADLRGCGFARAPGLFNDPLGAFTVDARGARALAASASRDANGPIARSDDGAASFVAIGAVGPAEALDSLLLGSADGGRVYASGQRFDAALAELVPTWLVSDDGARSFRSVDRAGARRPVGVDPSDSARVFASELTPGTSTTQLLRSDDGGESFSPVLALSSLLAFTSAADGERIWVGAGVALADDAPGGAFLSTDHGRTFRPVFPELIAVTCLVERAGRLWLCGHGSSMADGVWFTDGPDQPLTRYLAFTDVRAPVSCEAEADAAVCDGLWSDWQRELLGALPSGADAGESNAGESDAGESDAGQSAAPVDDASTPRPARAHTGCAVGPPGAPPACALGVPSWLALLGALWRRRLRAAHQPRPRCKSR